MTLVMLSVIPLLAVTAAVITIGGGRVQRSAAAAYAEANALVQESCAAIRTVFACTATQRQLDSYSQAPPKLMSCSHVRQAAKLPWPSFLHGCGMCWSPCHALQQPMSAAWVAQQWLNART